MSLFSTVGIIFFVIIATAGTLLKIILRSRRKDLEGFHGYINTGYVQGEEIESDDWKSL